MKNQCTALKIILPMEVCLAKGGGVSGNWQKVHFVDVSCIHITVVIVCYSESDPLVDFA